MAIALVIPSLFLYRPASFKQLPPPADTNEVSPYLTHQLLPSLYNGAQMQEPFDLVIARDGINDIISHFRWPIKHEESILQAPVVSFIADYIVIAAPVITRGIELIVTVRLQPVLDAEGLLNLHIAKVKIGAMNITPVARILASKLYESRLAENNIDSTDIKVQVAASLLTDKPFDPVFSIEYKKFRIKKINFSPQNLTLHLTPVPN